MVTLRNNGFGKKPTIRVTTPILPIPESGNNKPSALKMESFKVIISSKYICSHGGVDAFRKDGKKKIHEEHVVSFWGGSGQPIFGRPPTNPCRKETNP
jgi:hypothetical protein